MAAAPPMNTKKLIKGFEDGSIQGSPLLDDDETDSIQEKKQEKKQQQSENGGTPTSPPLADDTLRMVKRISIEDERVLPWMQDVQKGNFKHKVLIVYAHWEQNSFNGALLDAAVSTLTESGHEVVVTDLYSQSFNPLPSRADIKDGPRDPKHFSYPVEAGAAYERKALAADISAEQSKLAKADMVIFQFPLNWASVPAILKGYFDRVFVKNFAYDYGTWFDKGKFKGKKAVLSLTTGVPRSGYSEDGFMGDINILLWPIQNCILRFCGFDVLSPNIIFAPGRATDDERELLLTNWKKRLFKGIWREEPINFIPIDQFDPQTSRLKPDVLEKLAKTSQDNGERKAGLPIGQHAGREVTPNSMFRPEVAPRKWTNSVNK